MRLNKGNGESHTYYFNAISLMRFIFKKRGDQYIGRNNQDAHNGFQIPGLNQRVFGEIEFYMIELDKDKGYLIGTDYDF